MSQTPQSQDKGRCSKADKGKEAERSNSADHKRTAKCKPTVPEICKENAGRRLYKPNVSKGLLSKV